MQQWDWYEDKAQYLNKHNVDNKKQKNEGRSYNTKYVPQWQSYCIQKVRTHRWHWGEEGLKNVSERMSGGISLPECQFLDPKNKGDIHGQ